MKLSIVIVNWNTVDLLRSCLESIAQNKPHFDFEVLVVDNASKDDSVAMVRQEFPSIRLFPSPKNLGFGPGNNLAIRETAGEYVLLLNPDTEVIGDVLSKTVEYLDHNPDVGILGVKQREASGKLQESCGHFPKLSTMFLQMFFSLLIRLKATRLAKSLTRALDFRWMPVKGFYPFFDFDANVEVDWVMGAFMLIRGDTLRAEDGFDPYFVMYAEEIDLCKRIMDRGLKVHFFGGAEIFHYGGASTASISLRAEAMRTVAMIRFYQKHSDKLSTTLYRLLIFSFNLIAWARSCLSTGQDRHFKIKLAKLRIRAAVKPSYEGLFDVA